LDASCLVSQTGLTGVGYYTLHLLQALLNRHTEFAWHLFASSARIQSDAIDTLAPLCARTRVVRWPTRLKTWMWTSLERPSIETFTGSVDIAHGLFHLLPASRRAKRIVTVFDLTTLRHPETHTDAATHKRMLHHASRHADALIAISQSCKDDIVELLGVVPERVHVVYGGVFLNEFAVPFDMERVVHLKQRLGIPSDYMIHLGTLEPRKNVPRLLHAYAQVHAQRPDCPTLLLVGRKGWDYAPIFEAIRTLRLEPHVRHAGYVDRSDALMLLRGARACLYPSLYEGFGLPVLEAMAAGTPVLTSNVSSLPEVIGDTGILVDPLSVEQIGAGMLDLLENPTAAHECAAAARERAKAFTWEGSADTLAGVYRKVAAL